MFFFNSILLGIGLSMDAFSVSVANGLQDARMRLRKMILIAGFFGVFQLVMPLIGWITVHFAVQYMNAVEPFIPWIALGLLLFIGSSMIWEAIKPDHNINKAGKPVSFTVLITQGIATSIDALSVGFTISNSNWFMALTSSLIIGITTFIICMGGLVLGRRFGTHFTNKTGLLGGLILIGIGIEIWATNVFI